MSNNPSNLISDIGSTSLVVKSLKVGKKPTPNKFKCSQSENKLKITSKGIKEKIINRVRSWSSTDKNQVNDNIEVDTNLVRNQLGEESESMENIADSNLTRARDSLENVFKEELSNPTTEELRSRLTSSASAPLQKNAPESQKSSPDTSKAAAKNLIWDPFETKGRKNRKEQGRKKKNKKNVKQPKEECSSMPVEGKSCLLKPVEEKPPIEPTEDTETVEEDYTNYKYKYFPKNSKSVVFTNEVFVVYFHDNDVYESKEPLKKDVEQQERNKEMRQGHLLRTQEKYNLCLY